MNLSREKIISCIQIKWSPRPWEYKQGPYDSIIQIQCQGGLIFNHVHKWQTELCVRICSFPIYNLLNTLFLYMSDMFMRSGGDYERLGRWCVFWNFLSTELAFSNNSRCCQVKWNHSEGDAMCVSAAIWIMYPAFWLLRIGFLLVICFSLCCCQHDPIWSQCWQQKCKNHDLL